ncbi:MAG: hypothetical protein Q8M95_10480 [Candidatus Methanoperedens sp.]|nr:hypothetical protein [Candidatus Methanoperedens sp.]
MIGVDWGDETRWVLVGRTTKNKFYVIDTGVFDDVDTMQHVEKLKLIVSRENPKWIICDAGYGKTRNQILMMNYPGRVWSAFTNSGSNIPIFWFEKPQSSQRTQRKATNLCALCVLRG